MLLWWLADDPSLSDSVREVIREPSNAVAISAASAWEISIKRNLGKLDAPPDLEERIVAGGMESLSITVADATAAGGLPLHHDDPFDRMLIAQAGIRGLTLVTRDVRFEPYGVSLLRA